MAAASLSACACLVPQLVPENTAQSPAVCALAHAAGNLVHLLKSGVRPFLKAFEYALHRQPTSLPAAFAIPASHFEAAAHEPLAASTTANPAAIASFLTIS